MSKRTEDYAGCVCPTPDGECEPDVVPEDELDIVVPEDDQEVGADVDAAEEVTEAAATYPAVDAGNNIE